MTWLTTRIERLRTLRAARRADAGMTLLEILIVLAIVGLITAALAAGLFARSKDAKKKLAKTTVTQVQGSVELYMMDHSNNCPTALADVVADGKLEKKSAVDPWGKDYIVRCPGQVNTTGVDVLSAGPDKQEGTEDDIKAWD